ncbi:hypothetical protein [Bradyrhizobium sp. CCGUVB23]|uniref:hypothetical protein n=1 Tax=Bradyrhizobium sp. CCGUVB23 TaxID=2949630 RepID=UPI0020B3E243|nr:hypothetical protein [Bradyrhizobium sp. CCGUVB23]MCP3462622.1 hypothetical protein [Bradyrhizobium sp. CCGUVB23]
MAMAVRLLSRITSGANALLEPACFHATTSYLERMQLSDVHDHAIQARMALIVGARIFDRLFAGVRFDEVDGDILFVYAKNEDTAAKIEHEFALHISIVASKILECEINIVMVLPRQLVS